MTTRLPRPGRSAQGGRAANKKSYTISVTSSAPTRKSKFTRRGAADTDAAKNAHDISADSGAVTRQSICEQILVEGFPQSYVDFFYLSHRPDPNADKVEEGQPDDIVISPQDMMFIRDQLVAAERARRQGDTSTVYEAYHELARYYQDIHDPKTGVYFHEKCLEIAQLTGDRRGEMAANHNLGRVHQRMGEMQVAQQFHERHEQLATEEDVVEEVARANKELNRVYVKLAEQKESDQSKEDALELYKKALEASRKSWDRVAQGEANARVGRTLVQLNQPESGLPYLREYERIAADVDDTEALCHACDYLARANEKLGRDDDAVASLEKFVELAGTTKSLRLQSQACTALGTLYSRTGQIDQAIELFQRNFSIVTELAGRGEATSGEVDEGRVFMGIVRGMRDTPLLVSAMHHDVASLLNWKTKRAVLQLTGRRSEPKRPAPEEGVTSVCAPGVVLPAAPTISSSSSSSGPAAAAAAKDSSASADGKATSGAQVESSVDATAEPEAEAAAQETPTAEPRTSS